MAFTFNAFANQGNILVAPPAGVTTPAAQLDENFANTALLINTTNYPPGSTTALQLAAIATANGAAKDDLSNVSVVSAFGLSLIGQTTSGAAIAVLGAANNSLSNVAFLTAFGISLISTGNATAALATLGGSNTALTTTVANQITTNQTFTQNGSKAQRLNDTLDVGATTVNSRDFPLTTADWFSTFQISIGDSGTAVSTSMFTVANSSSSSAYAAIMGAAQSLHVSTGVSAGVAPSLFSSQQYGILNHASGYVNLYTNYGEAHRLVGALGSIYGMELDTRTLTASIAPNPNQQGDVIALQIASGAGVSATGQFDGSAALQIASNPMKWKVGINILAGSITSGGAAIAIPSNAAVQFVNVSGFNAGSVISTATGNNQTSINFTDSGMQIASADSSAIAYFTSGLTSGVNFLTFSGATTGNPAVIGANGADTNVNLRFQPKAGGLVQFGTAASFSSNGSVATSLGSIGPAGSHTAVQEWFTFQNAAGVTRYVPCF